MIAITIQFSLYCTRYPTSSSRCNTRAWFTRKHVFPLSTRHDINIKNKLKQNQTNREFQRKASARFIHTQLQRLSGQLTRRALSNNASGIRLILDITKYTTGGATWGGRDLKGMRINRSCGTETTQTGEV